jgi:hypothetical protein
MIDMTSILLVAFGSGSLLIAFVDYEKKREKAIEIDILLTPQAT